MMFLYNHTDIKPLNDVAFTLFKTDVYWYGVFIVCGALLAFLLGNRNAKRIGIKEDDLLDGFIWGLIIGVLGARLWYVMFDWSEFKDEPIRIITGFRSGGLAIHGGVVAGSIFAFFFCKKRKINPLKIAEILFPGFLIGQIFGRWGNFFNQEAHGGLVPGYPNLDLQRAWLQKFLPDFIVNQMYIDDYIRDVQEVPGYYHPTFFYESLWNVVGLAIIFLLRKFSKKYWVGDAMFFYLMWYSVGRYFIEGLRTDSLMAGSLRTAQVTSIVMFLIGAAGFVLRRVYKYYPVSYRDFKEEV
jgi:phosphatidylglycerol:prolipoprotein diacylglycerol transferase